MLETIKNMFAAIKNAMRNLLVRMGILEPELIPIVLNIQVVDFTLSQTTLNELAALFNNNVNGNANLTPLTLLTQQYPHLFPPFTIGESTVQTESDEDEIAPSSTQPRPGGRSA